MLIAQQLYEGVEIKGHGTVGLVSYIRTDSVRISDEARAAAKDYILEQFGSEFYQNNVYSNKKKDVQDAHEAIRPSYVEMDSQMSPARFKGVSASIVNGDYGFKATGSKLVFEGYLKVYASSKDEENDKLLPHLEEGESLESTDLLSEQNFTQPPARFTEASLVKDLEEKDIGRPSTYAPIIATIIDRKYVTREKKTLIPTELGFIVTQMMEDYFKEIVDTGFTAQMEDKLDEVEVKDVDWKDIIRDYYGTLEKELEVADKEIEKVEFKEELTGELCEKCGKPMVIKHGRFGEFAACTGYPECKNTKPIVKSINVKCPKCGKDIVARRSKTGRVFYGCSGYPDCQQSYWNKPIDRKCPKCGSLLVEKNTKKIKYACSNSECDYKEEQ